MDTHPQVEPLRRFGGHNEDVSQEPWHRSARPRLFILVCAVTLAIGVVWTILQPAVYRSRATVLMSAPTAIDAEISEADIQSVAIQRKILLGRDITERLLAELEDNHALQLSAPDLQALLQVNPLPDTNLVEMSAQGPDDEILPLLVESWIDVYLSVRAQEIEQRKAQTLLIVQDELDGLAFRLEEARDALDQYRERHEIISVERQENEVLARLDGLNSALNTAIEEEVKARSYLDTLRQAISQGEQVVPQSDRRGVEEMDRELRDLQTQMKELSKRYTMEYINKQPQLRAIPERIDELAAKLAQAFSQGREAELASARQAHAAARQTVADLQRKLDGHKKDVAQFNTVYATHEALVEDLASLEELNRETQERLVQVEVRQVDKYPQVSVIDRPRPDAERLGPNYPLLLGGTVVAALGLGVFSVWLYGFLNPRKIEPAHVTLSGVHLYPQEVKGELAYSTQPDPRLSQDTTPLLREESTGADPGPGVQDPKPDPDSDPDPDPDSDPDSDPDLGAPGRAT